MGCHHSKHFFSCWYSERRFHEIIPDICGKMKCTHSVRGDRLHCCTILYTGSACRTSCWATSTTTKPQLKTRVQSAKPWLDHGGHTFAVGCHEPVQLPTRLRLRWIQFVRQGRFDGLGSDWWGSLEAHVEHLQVLLVLPIFPRGTPRRRIEACWIQH